MLTNTEEILEILRPRVYNEELNGFYCGNFNSDKDKLVAATYVRLDNIDFDRYNLYTNRVWLQNYGSRFGKD